MYRNTRLIHIHTGPYVNIKECTHVYAQFETGHIPLSWFRKVAGALKWETSPTISIRWWHTIPNTFLFFKAHKKAQVSNKKMKQLNLWHGIINHCLEQWVKWVFKFYERYIRKNSRGRKRETTWCNTNESSSFMSDTSRKIAERECETTWCNTAKLYEPRPCMATPMHLTRSRWKSCEQKNE